MISTFDLTKLNALLEDFHRLTKIRITIFDDSFQELAAYPTQIAPFCQMIRSDEQGARACARCDREACRIAAGRKNAYIYRCHAGLTECIAPIVVSNIVIGYLLFGHLFSYPTHEEGFEKICSLCAPYSVDMEALREACFRQPIISRDYIVSASHILQAVAAYLCMERMVSLRAQELPVLLDSYLQEHYCEELDAMQIAAHFRIGKTQLYQLAKQNYGRGIAEQIRLLRIEKAKRLLLESPDLTLAQIAAECGFQDYNYFITVFKRMVGLPPTKWLDFESKKTASVKS